MNRRGVYTESRTLPTANLGVLYKVDSAGNYRVLHNFAGNFDGSLPATDLLLDPAGNIYGSTQNGGPADFGVLFKLDAAGHYTVLYGFASSQGALPSSVILDAAGNLFGTLYRSYTDCGVAYELDKSGNYTVLHTFTCGADGGTPSQFALLRDAAGNIFGTAGAGGTWDTGVIFEIKPQ
jgi:uncharacterized repeat protein (TIGR03803 family)